MLQALDSAAEFTLHGEVAIPYVKAREEVRAQIASK
jgi:hypothetical protein